MSFMDGVLLTLLNTAACLVLPKLLSVIFGTQDQGESAT
ncbi:hypothetical protein Anacy_0658 [Anabaena cylindrica PCC 7122]|uniref:Uncharacterized protein n=1 Tax=Anabaena cylindrica (strain ATCC 27899 / PCC 7122) TaxID=272123 RepID=K9ZAN5_ANACC|nr:hypothetical protein Anacy_0658 [Anabaena cylindrica PCC 7122]BAY01317.1 hypothetical protein NIES19_05470 [Anabaena cylindrica PCC 7122]